MNEELHIFTKGIPGQDYVSRHYILHDKGREQLAYLKENHDFKDYLITGAALSRDGNTLALLAYRYKFIFGILPDTDSKIFYYDVTEPDALIFNKPIGSMIIPTWFGTRQYESIDFLDQENIVIAAEKTGPLRPLMRIIKIPKYISKK